MKPSGVLLIALIVAVLFCINGCGGGAGSAGTALVPVPGQSSGPGPTPTPVGATPTPDPTSGPPPTPTPAPANVAVYQGCGVFTSGDWYNKPIGAASVDPNSANYISSVHAANTSGFYLSTGVEHANLASPSTPDYAVHATVSYHQNEFNANPPYPWMGGFRIEPLSDAHAIVFEVPPCHLFESYGTSWSGSSLSAYSGWTWDLTKPFQSLPAGWPSSMASGLSLFAGAVKAEEIQAGVINHALNWAGTAHSVSQWQFVSPASDTDGLSFSGGNPSYQLPYGAHLRLKASFNDSGFGPQAKAITTALKTYGMFLADTGSSNALYGIEAQDGLNHWNAGDLSALGNLHITDFEVLTLPTIQRVPGH